MARGPGKAAARAAGDNRGRRKKKRWNRRMESGVGNQVFGAEKRFSGFRVQVFRRFSSSTTKKSFEKNLACDLFGEFFSGHYKPTPLKMNLVLEIRLASKQVGEVLWGKYLGTYLLLGFLPRTWLSC